MSCSIEPNDRIPGCEFLPRCVLCDGGSRPRLRISQGGNSKETWYEEEQKHMRKVTNLGSVVKRAHSKLPPPPSCKNVVLSKAQKSKDGYPARGGRRINLPVANGSSAFNTLEKPACEKWMDGWIDGGCRKQKPRFT